MDVKIYEEESPERKEGKNLVVLLTKRSDLPRSNISNREEPEEEEEEDESEVEPIEDDGSMTLMLTVSCLPAET
jgi:hypothetical protein